MNSINWKGVLESLLFAAGDEGLSLKQVCSVLEIEEQKAKDVLEDLKNDYENDSNRGIYILEIAGTFQLVTKKRNADYLKKLVESPHVSFLSQAALETLAIIAYKQPITRMEIEQIRGVKTERPIQTLTSKGLVKEVGRAEGTGRAFLFGTTKEFLDYFGLKSIEELPPLPDNIEDEFAQDEADLFFEKFQETMETNE
ncbi:SMC-Scp complex subunit ScpB [Rossellomorea sp. SC111]|uniref:SMC-Scp complex subunit ScpB n=1 Tax=Rossellomorea sp. SC111 TaxID=2968985 RepID=UPI00215AA29A|nr:SMC-Scp complex subunit ScpB [Rossellomorea sp. SC111]MCR8846999.1 SMC-Scp complex subunit ScpB [Rossellomorea sp. SC111]